MHVVDLSQPLRPDAPRWPGSKPIAAEVVGDLVRDGVYERELRHLPEHVGTHLDAPAHFAAGGATVAEIAVERLVAPAVVYDASDLCGDDPDFALTAPQLSELGAAATPIRPGDAVLIRTGWDRFLDDPERYVGSETPRFPGLAPSGGLHVVERGAIGLGIDTLGVEPGCASTFPLHQITLAAGLWHVEGLVGLDQLPHRGATLVVGVLPLVDGSGAPARVLALISDQLH